MAILVLKEDYLINFCLNIYYYKKYAVNIFDMIHRLVVSIYKPFISFL